MTIHPLENYKLFIFDVDGTLRRCTVPGQPCPNKWDEWELLPHVKETLGYYDWGATHHWCWATNQGGVALGFLTQEACLQLFLDLAIACEVPLTGPLWHFHVCYHHPQAGCPCRKPSPYLLLQAVDEAGVRLDETLYIGDLASDAEAAARAGIAYMDAQLFFNR